MQKQMIVTVPEELLEGWCSENNEHLKSVTEGIRDFLDGKEDFIILPDSFSYEIKDVDSDISEVVITYDRGE